MRLDTHAHGSDQQACRAQANPCRVHAKVRGLRKKLASIIATEDKAAAGLITLSQEQREKLARKDDIIAELATLEQNRGKSTSDSAPQSPQSGDSAEACHNMEPEAEPVIPGALAHLPADAGVVKDLGKVIGHAAVSKPPKSPKPMISSSPTLELKGMHRRPLPGPTCQQASETDVGGSLNAMARTPSMRWHEDPVAVEDVVCPASPSPKEPQVQIIENFQVHDANSRSSVRAKNLIAQVRQLSYDAFGEDAFEMVTKKGKWKITLLALPPDSPTHFSLQDNANYPLIGFIVYRLRPDLQSLAIAKLAIVPEHRRKGHGVRLINWCINLARKQPNLKFISLSSLPEAVQFYTRLGFRQHTVKFTQNSSDCGPDEELVEGQVYMEKPIKGGRGARAKRGRR